MESLGELVKIWRKESGLTQPALARLIGDGVTYQNIQQLENGKAKQPRYIAALALAMGTSVDALLALQMPPKLGEASTGTYYTPAPLIEALSIREGRRLTNEDRQLIEDLNALLPEERARYRKEIGERAALMRKHAEYLRRPVEISRAPAAPEEASEQLMPPPAPRVSTARDDPAGMREKRESLMSPPATHTARRRAK